MNEKILKNLENRIAFLEDFYILWLKRFESGAYDNKYFEDTCKEIKEILKNRKEYAILPNE